LGVSPFARYCQPLKPGEIYEVDLEIWPMGLALPKGSRLTLTIQGKDFERPGATGPLRGRRLVHSATTRPIVRPNCLPARTRFMPAGSINPIFCCPCCPCQSRLRVRVPTRLIPPRSVLDPPSPTTFRSILLINSVLCASTPRTGFRSIQKIATIHASSAFIRGSPKEKP